MSREVEQLVRRAAATPTRELDTSEVVARARRQAWWLRAGTGIAGVVVVAIVGLLALPVGGTGPGIEVADEPGASEVEQLTTVEDLEGRTFVSTEVVEDGSPRELVDDTVLTVIFDPSSPFQRLESEHPDEGVEHDTWLRWDAGCNHHESAVVLDGNTLELVGRNMVTSSLCPDDKEEQNGWLRDFFGADPTWTLEGRQLTLASEDIVIVLEDSGHGPANDPDGEFTLGETYLWQAEGDPEEVATAFARRVLGWTTIEVRDHDGVTEQPADRSPVTVTGTNDRTLEVYLEEIDGRWSVVQAQAALEQPISTTDAPSLYWRPLDEAIGERHAFDASRGIAYLRTPQTGTVTIPLEERQIEGSEVALDGHIPVGDEPFCHQIQTALLLFQNDDEEITGVVGGVWSGDEPPPC